MKKKLDHQKLWLGLTEAGQGKKLKFLQVAMQKFLHYDHIYIRII